MLKSLVKDHKRQPFTLITLRGTPIRVQLSALILPLWAAYIGYITNDAGWRGAAFMGVFVLLLHVCAMLHELGHILPAHRFGATITQVRMSGLGAFVRVESKVGMTPRQNLWIALGGPAVSALSTVILGCAAWRVAGAHRLVDLLVTLLRWDASAPAAMLVLLAATNALLMLFNLLPVFPMDGGRGITACLALFLPQRQATAVVSSFGQVMAAVTIPAALFMANNSLLRLVAVSTAGLVFWVSWRESRRVQALQLL